MPNSVALCFHHRQFIVDARRALFWPDRHALILSDLHLGKGDIFRAAGIAVPSGGTQKDLNTLAALIGDYGAREVIIVGDLIHAARPNPLWLSTWRDFQAQHREVSMHVVIGNHDRHLDHATLNVEPHTMIEWDGITFAHDQIAAEYQINGHVHPMVNVPGITGRWPCFWVRENTLTLPAFSLFTGGHRLESGEAWIACIHDEVLANLR